jgi:hypothetical protein
MKELVTITVPKKVEQVLTNGLSPYEVQSRLKVLANTLDSRGWAIKNSSTVTMSPVMTPSSATASDRLIDFGNALPAVPDEEVPAGADILDDMSSPVAQHFTQMITQSSQAYRQHLIQQMNSTTQTPAPTNNNQWFMPSVDASLAVSPPPSDDQVAARASATNEADLVAKLRAQKRSKQTYSSNLRTIQPIAASPTQTTKTPVSKPTSPPLTDKPDPTILSLANNNDFNLSTIAREAKRAKDGELGEGEVVVKLH